MESVNVETKAIRLKERWEELKKDKPQLRIRDCATELGVSEAELLATTVGEYTTRIQGEWTSLFQRLPELGRVMSLTRNEACVLEHKGPFQKIDVIVGGPHVMATVIGPIETRVFFQAWTFGFAVRQQTPRGLQQSLQFFDKAGSAVTKVFLVEPIGNKAGSNREAFDNIVKDFSSPEQTGEMAISEVQAPTTKPTEDVDKEALLAEWKELKDTHDFFGLLRRHKVNRLDAVRIAEGNFTKQIDRSSLQRLLNKAAEDKLPIMIFAGNHGNLQIHQGKVQTIRVMDNWLNVLDPDFNMHLREDLVDSVWVVHKPTNDGVVTGVEVFNKEKEMIVQFFGLRKPGIPELEKWRTLVSEL